jgi:hypothetical protein
MSIGKAGTDPRMLFSWYSGDCTTDPQFAELPPEQRANPSMASWVDGAKYIEQQRTRLPSGRFRRLHLNLPGSPQGAAFDQAKILAAVVTGRRSLPPEAGRKYTAMVDMSGGSVDDAVLCLAHLEDRIAVIDLVEKQSGKPPFSPRQAVSKFCGILGDYGLRECTGDSFAGRTFVADFEAHGIKYIPCRRPKSDLYEAFEPRLNAGEVELLDHPAMIEQAVCLVWRGQRIDHEPGAHDDLINAVAGAVAVMVKPERDFLLDQPLGTVPAKIFNADGWINQPPTPPVLPKQPMPTLPSALADVELSPEAKARLEKFKADYLAQRSSIQPFYSKCFGI